MRFKKICVIGLSVIISLNATVSSVFAKELDNLSARNVIVMDVNTGDVVYEKNSKQKVQIASTTKLMTALLLAENREKTDLIAVTKNALAQPSSSIYKDYNNTLTQNDFFTAEDVMKGLLMASGNDMAVAIAENIAGTESSFSVLMNDKARSLGMVDTDYCTASGLDTDAVLDGENHYSTAYDMALLAIEAYKDEWIREVLGTKSDKIGAINKSKFEITNTNKNLGLNGCVGGKTGYTTKAQRCLVAFYEKEDRLFVGVVLGGSNPGYFNDMDNVVAYSAEAEKLVVKEEGAILGFNYFIYNLYGLFDKNLKKEFPMVLKENVYMYDNDLNINATEYEISQNKVSIWNIKEDSIVGVLKVKEPNKVTEYNLYIDKDTFEYVDKANSKILICIYFVAIGSIAFVCYKIFRKKS